jgi:hypothetical protein
MFQRSFSGDQSQSEILGTSKFNRTVGIGRSEAHRSAPGSRSTPLTSTER